MYPVLERLLAKCNSSGPPTKVLEQDVIFEHKDTVRARPTADLFRLHRPGSSMLHMRRTWGQRFAVLS
jgi:hypothetical protein